MGGCTNSKPSVVSDSHAKAPQGTPTWSPAILQRASNGNENLDVVPTITIVPAVPTFPPTSLAQNTPNDVHGGSHSTLGSSSSFVGHFPSPNASTRTAPPPSDSEGTTWLLQWDGTRQIAEPSSVRIDTIHRWQMRYPKSWTVRVFVQQNSMRYETEFVSPDGAAKVYAVMTSNAGRHEPCANTEDAILLRAKSDALLLPGIVCASEPLTLLFTSNRFDPRRAVRYVVRDENRKELAEGFRLAGPQCRYMFDVVCSTTCEAWETDGEVINVFRMMCADLELPW